MEESNPRLEDLSVRLDAVERRLAALESGTAPTPAPIADPASVKIDTIDGKTLEFLDEHGNARFSWRLVLVSKSEIPLRIDARIQFVDMNSFALEEHLECGLLVSPHSRQKFTGIYSIPVEVEERIMGLKASFTVVE